MSDSGAPGPSFLLKRYGTVKDSAPLLPFSGDGEAPGRTEPTFPETAAARAAENGRSAEPLPSASEVASLEAKVLRIERELADCFRALVRERRELTGLAGQKETARVQLSISVPPDEGARPGTEALFDQLRRSAARFADETAAFPAGHVYCYWCRSFRCVHSRPASPRAMFNGYSATGQPLWNELGSVLLERQDPRIDLLFGESSSILTLTQTGGELASRQLAVYGKGSPIYRILGQVTVGYLQPPPRSSIAEPFALTFQAVEAPGEHAAQLNILAFLPPEHTARQLLEEHFDPRITDAVVTTRRRLREIGLTRYSRRRRHEKTRHVLDALRSLERTLDRIFRQSRRRTLHARTRHRNPRRPTSVALRDAVHARQESVYRDIEERTWIVLGPKNRVHVFNDRAQHVTSVVYPGETVRARTTRGKWVRAPESDISGFLETVRNHATPEERRDARG